MSDKVENCASCGVDVNQDQGRHGLDFSDIYETLITSKITEKIIPHVPSKFRAELRQVAREFANLDKLIEPIRKELLVIYRRFLQAKGRSIPDEFNIRWCESCWEEWQAKIQHLEEKFKSLEKHFASTNAKEKELKARMKRIESEIKDEIGEEKWKALEDKIFNKKNKEEMKEFLKKEIMGGKSSNSNITNSQLVAKEQEITELREELTKLKQEIEQLKREIPVSNIEEKQKKEEKLASFQVLLKTKSEKLENKAKEIQQISSQANQNNQPTDKTGLWIGLGVAGLIIVGIIAYWLGKRKTK